MSTGTASFVAQVTNTDAAAPAASSSARPAQLFNSDSALPSVQQALSDDCSLPSTLVVIQAASPSTNLSLAASSTQSTPKVSPNKAARETHLREASKLQHTEASPQPRMTTRAMRNAESLQEALLESETARSQSLTASSLPLVVVTVSATTSQERPLVLTVEEAPQETLFVSDAQAAIATTNNQRES